MEITGNVNATVNAEVDRKMPFAPCEHVSCGGLGIAVYHVRCRKCGVLFQTDRALVNCCGCIDRKYDRKMPFIVKCLKHGLELPCGACHFTQPQTRRIKKTPKMNEQQDYDLEMIRSFRKQLDEKRAEIKDLEFELDVMLDNFERHAIEERE